MESLVLWSLVIVMMLSGTNCRSTSKSCSYVNGQMICNEEQSDGNIAGASSGAFFNGQNSYQQTSAGTGDTNTGTSSFSSTQAGNLPPGTFVGPASFGIGNAFGGLFGGAAGGAGTGGGFAGAGTFAGPAPPGTGNAFTGAGTFVGTGTFAGGAPPAAGNTNAGTFAGPAPFMFDPFAAVGLMNPFQMFGRR